MTVVQNGTQRQILVNPEGAALSVPEGEASLWKTEAKVAVR